MRNTAALIITICLAVAAFANDNTPATPSPGPGNTRLSKLIGTWYGDAQNQEVGKPATTVRAKVDCRAASGGFGVQCAATFTSPEMNMLESDLFGYDSAAQKVHWYSITNYGEVHDHVGNWIDDSRLAVRFQGSDTVEDITLKFDGSKKMAFDVLTSVNGSPTSTLKGSLQRR